MVGVGGLVKARQGLASGDLEQASENPGRTLIVITEAEVQTTQASAVGSMSSLNTIPILVEIGMVLSTWKDGPTTLESSWTG